MSLEQEQIREMLEQAVYQQLFSTDKEDRIMGKNPEYTMQFTGVKELLDNFLDELNNNLDLVLDFKIGKFLEVFEKRFDIDLDGTEERIMTNFEGMGGKDIVMQNDTMLIYMVLTKMVEAIREKAYAKWGKRRIIEQYEEITGKKFNENINEEVNKLAAINNRSISLLYNLSFLTFLAEAYGKDTKAITGKRLCTMKVNKMIRNELSNIE